MTFDEMTQAVREAQHTLDALNRQIGTMAGMIAGRLRSGGVYGHHLRKLKEELRDYNIHTGTWRKH